MGILINEAMWCIKSDKMDSENQLIMNDVKFLLENCPPFTALFSDGC